MEKKTNSNKLVCLCCAASIRLHATGCAKFDDQGHKPRRSSNRSCQASGSCAAEAGRLQSSRSVILTRATNRVVASFDCLGRYYSQKQTSRR